MREGHTGITAQAQPPPTDADLPPSLRRALVEAAEYALRLRTGEVVRFTRAERHGAFAILYAPSELLADPRLPDPMAAFPHGLEVRISDIVWCARGPAPAAEAGARGAAPGDVAGVTPEQSAGVRVALRIKHGEHDAPDVPGEPRPHGGPDAGS